MLYQQDGTSSYECGRFTASPADCGSASVSHTYRGRESVQ